MATTLRYVSNLLIYLIMRQELKMMHFIIRSPARPENEPVAHYEPGVPPTNSVSARQVSGAAQYYWDVESP
jgi:hypothetical protein